MTRYGLCARGLALLLCSTPIAAQRSARRVIDARQIAAAGWHRLGDIASALPPGTTASVDGFNHILTSSRISFLDADATSVGWIVRLDGQRMPVSIGGLWILDAIPVAITQLDSIVIAEGPRLVDGRSVLMGVIDLHTRRLRKTVSLIADYQHGDESGDPGPYRYTARTTENIEKAGPFASGAVGLSVERASVDVAARYSSLNITDARIAARFPGVFGALQSDVNASGGSGVITTRVLRGEQYLVAGRGRFTGLMNVPVSGQDQTGRVITSHLGSSGTMSVDRIALRYAATMTELRVNPLASPIPFTIGETRQLGEVLVEGGAGASPFRVGIGATYGEQARGTATDSRLSERAWLSYARFGESASLAVDHSAGKATMSGSLRVERSLADSETYAVTVTAIDSWLDAEHAWMDGFGTANAHARALTSLDARLEVSTRELLALDPIWYLRVFRLSGLRESTDDDVIAAGIHAVSPIGDPVSLSLRGEVSQRLGGPDNAEASTPGGYVEVAASTAVPGGFLLSLSGRYAPRTTWPELEPGAQTILPSTRRIDFSVNKRLWKDRVRGQLVIRNLLNAAEVTHPLGAQWSLRTHLAVTIELPPFPTRAR